MGENQFCVLPLLGWLGFGGGFAFGHPIAAGGLSVAFGLGFAFDGVTADFASVFGHALVTVHLSRDFEGNFVAFDRPFFNWGVVVPTGNGAGHLFTLGFEFEGGFANLIILVGHAGFPGAGQFDLFILGLNGASSGKYQDGSDLDEWFHGFVHVFSFGCGVVRRVFDVSSARSFNAIRRVSSGMVEPKRRSETGATGGNVIPLQYRAIEAARVHDVIETEWGELNRTIWRQRPVGNRRAYFGRKIFAGAAAMNAVEGARMTMPYCSRLKLCFLTFAFIVGGISISLAQEAAGRPRAREAGVLVGTMSPGPLNAITDVAGVRVGHVTVREGERIHMGVTAIFPHDGNVFQERVPAAIHVGNGFGKLIGVTQVQELGELETPLLLTGTLSVWKTADAFVGWLLAQPGMAEVRSINPVVGETNDGFLNDIRARPIQPEHVIRALVSATNGPVAEGSVGAGAGTVAFGWKGGIGTSSRQLPATQRGYTVGVLVQSNFGGDLTIAGVPVGRELARRATSENRSGDGSIMIVVATDAPLSARNLERLAARALFGLARTGSSMSNGSGDYVIAFSTASECRRRRGEPVQQITELANEVMTPLFQAVAEATEEAIYNSLFRATTVKGFRGTVEALPLERTMEVLRQAGRLVPAVNGSR
jgi:D-aminopeptidase